MVSPCNDREPFRTLKNTNSAHISCRCRIPFACPRRFSSHRSAGVAVFNTPSSTQFCFILVLYTARLAKQSAARSQLSITFIAFEGFNLATRMQRSLMHLDALSAQSIPNASCEWPSAALKKTIPANTSVSTYFHSIRAACSITHAWCKCAISSELIIRQSSEGFTICQLAAGTAFRVPRMNDNDVVCSHVSQRTSCKPNLQHSFPTIVPPSKRVYSGAK